MDDQKLPSSSAPSSSSTFPLHLPRDIKVDVEEPVPPVAGEPLPHVHAIPEQLPVPPNEPGVQHPIVWPRILKLIGILAAVAIVVLLVNMFVIPKKKTKAMFECNINFSVSKNGSSDFRTVSEAIEASPSYSPLKICILIRVGEYHEMVKIGPDKTNLILMGEGTEKTTIISNASAGGYSGDWRAATLRVIGKDFTAQDMTISNLARDGVAVDNWSSKSVFFRCNIRGANMSLHMDGQKQYYRDCGFYGETYLVTGDAYTFFQRCNFVSKSAYVDKEIVLIGQSRQFLIYKTGFIFHPCAFNTNGNSRSASKKVFIGSALGDAALIVVMQSYLDASITSFLTDSFSLNTTYFALFGNTGPGAATITTAPFVHILREEEAESEFSLRAFLDGETWILPEVESDLDLAK